MKDKYRLLGNNERMWVDQWYESLIFTLQILDLIKTHPLNLTNISRTVLYEKLASYK